jgi:hypothetical protein
VEQGEGGDLRGTDVVFERTDVYTDFEESRDQEVESEVREEEVCVWGKDVESEWLGVVYMVTMVIIFFTSLVV